MFTFLKIIKPFLLPPVWIFLGIIAALLLVWKGKKKAGTIVLIATAGLYYMLSIEPVAYLLTMPLETLPQEDEFAASESVDAIVILAGGADKPDGYRKEPELGGVSWRRLWRGIEVYRSFEGRIPIIYSGGSGDPFDTVSIESELAQSYALSIGIPEEDFVIERESRTTWESGLALRILLDEYFPEHETHHIMLVTSAWHMPRALFVMEQNGIVATPIPADVAGGAFHGDIVSFFPSTSAFQRSVTSIHEWIGLGGYWLQARLIAL